MPSTFKAAPMVLVSTSSKATVTFTSCATNDLSGNTEGEHNGCDACTAE